MSAGSAVGRLLSILSGLLVLGFVLAASPAQAQEEMTDAFCQAYLESIGHGDAWPRPVGLCKLEWERVQGFEACVVDLTATECWSCKFVDRFASTGLEAAARAYTVLAPGFVGIIQYVFFVWIVLQALKMFMPDGNGLAVLKGVAIKSLLLVIVLFALTGGGMLQGDSSVGGAYSTFPFYRDWIFVPIMSGGGELAAAILNAFGAGSREFTDVFGPLMPVQSSVSPAFGSGLEQTFTVILDVIGKMQQISGWGFTMGLSMISGTLISIDILQLLGGLALIFFFGIALISFPFYIIDLFFRAILLTVLAPVAIASVMFKPTRRVTISALTGLIQSAATVAILGAVVSLVGALMTGALGINGNGYTSFGDWACAIEHGEAEFSFGLSRPEYWYLVCAGILAVGAMAKARGLVGALISGFDDGKSLGETAGNLAKGGMMFVAQAAPAAILTSAAMTKASAGAAVGGATTIAGRATAAMTGATDALMRHLPGFKSKALVSSLTAAGMASGNASAPGAAPDVPMGSPEATETE